MNATTLVGIARLLPGGRHVTTLSPSPAGGGGLSPMLLVGIAALGLAVFIYVLRADLQARYPRRRGVLTGLTWTLGIIGVAFTLGAITATPTPSELVNPVPLTVDSIAAGRGLFESNCAQCHGVSARGGGPDAGTTSIPPADLLSGHINQHTDGDVYTWISGGLPGGMPAWQGNLTATQIWELVDFLRAINTGQAPVEGPTPTPGPAGGSGSSGSSALPGSASPSPSSGGAAP
jgi:mono/diheme cytochrome c family protein